MNWGLGHASRIVAVVNLLQSSNEIIIAADGSAYHFLKAEFPSLTIVRQKEFSIRYTKSAFLLPFRMLISIQKLFWLYFYNKKWVKDFVDRNQVDLIISDNKFGFFSKKVKSIFITHQLNIQVPKALKFFKPLVDFLNNWNIKKFDELWIPDNQKVRISGVLSENKKLKVDKFFIGILSRFYQTNDLIFEDYHYVCIVSGPEPQKTLLIEKIKKIFFLSKKKSLIVTGNPDKKQVETIKNIKIVNHLTTAEISYYLRTSIIVTRAGYSSIMDLLTLGRSAILIPTPGQTEQIYLANYLHTNRLFFCVQQRKLSIDDLIFFEQNRYEFMNNMNKLKINDNLEMFLKNRKLI